MNQSEIDEAVGYVTKIIENIRCATCDRLEGSRMRYPCGHTACDECVIYADYCQSCTPPQYNSELKPDQPLTQAVKNATELLKACRNLFNVNAFQHKRVSEQLKIEKQLFPQCLQAPVKYENKRKSSIFSINNKENTCTTYFPGEEISTVEDKKMENSVNYVQQWLNKNEQNLTRKPFSDLNVNTQRVACYGNKRKQNVGNENVSKGNRKRSLLKTKEKEHSLGNNKKTPFESHSSPKKVKKESYKSHKVKSNCDNQKECDNDESGIFMDNDPIVINDSQDIDKDKEAWLAVLRAHDNEDSQSTSIFNSSQVNITNDSNKLTNNVKETKQTASKVPFFKKSAIYESCVYCRSEVNSEEFVPTLDQTKPVKITIDNEHFLTTITVFRNVQNDKVKNTSNVSAQINSFDGSALLPQCNDLIGNEDVSPDNNLVDNKSVSKSDKQSEDLFNDDKEVFENVLKKADNNKCIVIEESDTDTDIEVSGPMSVKVDVHRSYDELESGTLNEVVNIKKHESKSRRRPRGHTPTSTDSSEKENYNPNRMRKNRHNKKKCFKKEKSQNIYSQEIV